MHPKIHARRFLLGAIALCLMLGGVAKAQPVDRGGTVIVPAGGAVRLQMRSKKLIKQVFNEKPNIVLVESDAANPAYVILRGQQQGTSRLELTDVDKAVEAYEVVVQTDLDLLRNILKRAVPTANVEVIPFGTGVVLTGSVARTEDVDTVLRVAGTILGGGAQNVVNALTVGGVHQVQLDVTVARVDRTKIRKREFAFIVGGSTVSAGSILGGLTSATGSTGNSTIASGVGITSGVASALPNGNANLVFGIAPANLQMLLQALKTEGLAKLIACPKLVTQSGRPARFQSGGQQAIVSQSSGISGPGSILQDFGTELDFVPIVYGNGKIQLDVMPSVTTVNFANGITINGNQTPGFDKQFMRTSVVMESGQTFAIGGLIQTATQASTTKVPVLGDIPFLGSLFSSVTQTEDEQELVILVTPHLVDPMDCNQVPNRLPGRETRTPDDFELYLESMLELPRGQRNVFENRRYKAAWKNSPTAGAYPCGVNGNGGNGGGNCATGTCAPASKGMAVIGSTPYELPPAVIVPKDFSFPARER